MGILELWVPIVVSAIIVFVASALVWVVLPWHKSDFRKLRREDDVRSALNGTATGLYLLPYCTNPAELKDEAMRKKFVDGPVAYVTVVPNGAPSMAPKLIASLIYNLVVSAICAYVLSRTMMPDWDYLQVFRITGTAAFIAYGIAYLQDSIWFGRPWSLTFKSLVDALIYGLLTGGAFGWLATS